MLLWVQLLICFSLTIEDASLFLAMYMWTAPASSQAIWVASPPVSATGECSTVNDCTLQVLQIDGLPKEWPNITGTVLSSFRLLTICGNDLHWYFRFQASQLLPLGLLFPLSSTAASVQQWKKDQRRQLFNYKATNCLDLCLLKPSKPNATFSCQVSAWALPVPDPSQDPSPVADKSAYRIS